MSQQLLHQAAAAFGFDAETLVFLSNSSNEVYRFVKNNQPHILRMSAKPAAYVKQIQAEIDWVYYLALNGVRTSLPVHTSDGQLTAVYSQQEQCYIATAFQMAPGCFFDKSDPQLWGPSIFRLWGETMGRIHLLTKSYSPADPAARRSDWGRRRITNPYLHQGRYRMLTDKLEALEDVLSSLPRDTDSYGLIHNDFHPYNFHIDKGELTVFDFDDSIYGWYALDIAIAAVHAVWWGPPGKDRQSKNKFAAHFLNEFLTGYSLHHVLSAYWIQQLPMLMDYRNICSYFWWLDAWNGDESGLSESQQAAIAHAVMLISKGQRFEGCDFIL
ncbi:phosphotransferase [Paenibacillus sp. FSL H8-0048]|uniref:phosphotransferase enzyme family protein n=1 Tax=Paenibacillus sp. FSL H8-0048 TaxID=2954508 RepID=UPI0030F9197D